MSENKSAAINTNVRLFDLVRYMRSELHEQDLITDEEYAWLCGSEMASSKQGGSPSPRRLEDYDGLQRENNRLRRELEEAINNPSNNEWLILISTEKVAQQTIRELRQQLAAERAKCERLEKACNQYSNDEIMQGDLQTQLTTTQARLAEAKSAFVKWTATDNHFPEAAVAMSQLKDALSSTEPPAK